MGVKHELEILNVNASTLVITILNLHLVPSIKRDRTGNRVVSCWNIYVYDQSQLLMAECFTLIGYDVMPYFIITIHLFLPSG